MRHFMWGPKRELLPSSPLTPPRPGSPRTEELESGRIHVKERPPSARGQQCLRVPLERSVSSSDVKLTDKGQMIDKPRNSGSHRGAVPSILSASTSTAPLPLSPTTVTQDSAPSPSRRRVRLSRRSLLTRARLLLAAVAPATDRLLIAYAGLAVYPHFLPYNQDLLMHATLFVWRWQVWCSLALTLWLASLCAAVDAFKTRRPEKRRWGVRLRRFVALVAPPLAAIWVWVILPQGQELSNGFLRMCFDYCNLGEDSPGNPWHMCYQAPRISADGYQPRSAANAAEAVDFFRDNVFGPLPNMTASAAWDASAAATKVTLTSWLAPTAAECSIALAVTPPFPGAVLGAGSVVAIAPGGVPTSLVQRLGAFEVQVRLCTERGALISREAAALNAVALALKRTYGARVVSYGCSVGGKIAYWAAALEPRLYTQAFIDSGERSPGLVRRGHVVAREGSVALLPSLPLAILGAVQLSARRRMTGGAFGPAKLRTVGPCGESIGGMVGRWPSWLAPGAGALPPPAEWPGGVDVDDLMLEACLTTQFHIAYGLEDLWNNPDGTRETIANARIAGCNVTVVESSRNQHCGHFPSWSSV